VDPTAPAQTLHAPPTEPVQPISNEALALVEGGEALREHVPKRLVLAAIANQPSIPRAAKAAGVHVMTVYGWLGRISAKQSHYDPIFTKAFDLCFEFGVMRLEEIAQDRAIEYSDRLLMFLLKAYDRKRFGDVEIDDGSKKPPVNVQVVLHQQPNALPSARANVNGDGK